jgi:hypothetical protein
MRARELFIYSLKARIVSWLTSGAVPVLTVTPNGPVPLAVYVNGRYAEFETVAVPPAVPPDWVGPDGPFRMPGDENGEGVGEDDS